MAELIRLGASVERGTRDHDPEGPVYFVVMHDPEGNEFCAAEFARWAHLPVLPRLGQGVSTTAPVAWPPAT